MLNADGEAQLLDGRNSVIYKKKKNVIADISDSRLALKDGRPSQAEENGVNDEQRRSMH